MSFLLTDEEIATAQMEYCKPNNLHFPLWGQARDDCLIKAQAKKLVEALKGEDSLNYSGTLDNPDILIIKVRTKWWQALKKEVEDG